MKFRNLTDSFKTFVIPQLDGSPKWYDVPKNEVVEIPDSEGWRAKASGLSEVKTVVVKPIKVEPVKKHKS